MQEVFYCLKCDRRCFYVLHLRKYKCRCGAVGVVEQWQLKKGASDYG